MAHNIASRRATSQTRAPLTTGDAIYVWYIFLLCQPYIHWLGVGTASDVQVYPLLLAAPLLAHQLLSNVVKAQKRIAEQRRDPVLLGLLLAVVPIAAVQVVAFESPVSATLRGLYGYLSIGILTWTWVWVVRAAGPRVTALGLKVTFWAWTAVGAIQLVKPDFATFWRDKLIITPGRGSLSFATEPAYFAFAVLLVALAIWLLTGSSRYLILATVVIALVARSSVGIVYCLVAALFVAPGSVARKLALLGGVVGLWFAATALFPTTRIGTASSALLTDPFALISTDMSVGLRYINVVYPLQGFLDNWGLPHGLTAWPYFQWRSFAADPHYYFWAVAYNPANPRGSILSIHGQLLFELGAYAFVYYRLFWKIIRRSDHPLGLAAIGLAIFLNGVTLNSPFFALVLAAAYVQREVRPTAAEEVQTPEPADERPQSASRLARPGQQRRVAQH